jgi:hypothetical protein
MDSIRARERTLRGLLVPIRRCRAFAPWFSEHLDAPEVASVERFWFRAEAADHIARARRLAELLRDAGFPIVERRTERVPGKVRAEDPNQIAVVTYRDAPRPGRRTNRKV